MTAPNAPKNTPEPTVHLVGESHLGQHDQLSRGLERLLTTADIAVFYTEHPAELPTIAEYATAAVSLPLYLIGMCVTQMLYGPLYALRSGTQQAVETEAVRELSSEHGVPVVPVDTHPSQVVPELSVGWHAVGWLGLLLGVAVAPFQIGVFSVWVVACTGLLILFKRRRVTYETPLALLFGWGGLVAIVPLGLVPLAFGVVAFIAHGLVIRVTAERREAAMAQRLLNHVPTFTDQDVCLTVGEAHLEGLVTEFDARGIETVLHTDLSDQATASD
ncbi:hypothetical protein C455_08537 [Haloferax larsenii JCM 13917]|nr:hypothetical protein [Haloferax larsenii]ELZ79618.1 hypothetical protein C455_08537 [Haloferax larsenii JCM 13917]